MLDYKHGAMAVCYLNGEFTLKRIEVINKKAYLMPANKDFQPIEVNEDDEFMIWGIVTNIIKKVYK